MFLVTSLNFFFKLFVSVFDILIVQYSNQRTNDYQSNFSITAKALNIWKVHVLVIT